METMKSAVVVGKVPWSVTKPTKKPQRAPGPQKPQRQPRDIPTNPREVNAAQLRELQFLKHQINSLRQDLTGYDDLMSAVAKLVAVVSVNDGHLNDKAVEEAYTVVAEVFKTL